MNLKCHTTLLATYANVLALEQLLMRLILFVVYHALAIALEWLSTLSF